MVEVLCPEVTVGNRGVGVAGDHENLGYWVPKWVHGN